MEGNAGRVQVLARLEKLINRITDLQRHSSWNAVGPAAATEQRGHIFDIRIETIPLEVQRGTEPSHSRATFWTGLPISQGFLFGEPDLLLIGL